MSREHSVANACPSEEVILGYLKGELSEVEVEDFEKHYFACDTCFDELERAREIRAALTTTSEAGATASRSSGYRRLLLLAATIAFLAVALWVWWSLLPGSEGLVRRSEEGALLLTVEASALAVSSTWTRVPGAVSYLLQVYTREGELLLERETSETTMRLETGLFEERVMYLRVQALDALGESLSSSPLEEIALRRE